jgi:hypothetical protein
MCDTLTVISGKFSGRCPETRSLFAKSEAKTLIRVLRILAQSAETAVSAGGVGAEPPQIFEFYFYLTRL